MHHYRKTFILIVLSLLMMLLPCAMAEETGTAEELFDAAEGLLFETDNVTIEGNAEFSLDGTRFKTALGRYVQDGTNSFYRLRLRTPRKKGGEFESGFTVIANDWDFFSMETMYPGTYTTGMDNKENTLLRKTFMVSQLTDLVHNVLLTKSDMLSSHISTQETASGKSIHFQWNGEEDPLVNSVLTMAARFAMQRFLAYEPDRMEEEYTWDFSEYGTVTEAICETTTAFSLLEADISCTLENSHLTSVKGSISLGLADTKGDKRVLDITCSAEAGSYGSSHVDLFDPEEYGVTEVEDWERYQARAFVNPDKAEELIEEGRRIAELAGYDSSSLAFVGFTQDDEFLTLHMNSLNESENMEFCFYHDTLCLFQIKNTAWMKNPYMDEPEGKDAEALAEEAKKRITAFLSHVYPSLLSAIEEDGQIRLMEEDGNVYLQLEWDTGDEVFNDLFFIFRTEPDWHIEHFSSIGFG